MSGDDCTTGRAARPAGSLRDAKDVEPWLHAPDCAIWVGESCDCVTGKIPESLAVALMRGGYMCG